MPSVVHLILLVLALVSFGLSISSAAAPYWNRLISIGLTAFIASMITW